MFKFLKEKLGLFKRKASEEIAREVEREGDDKGAPDARGKVVAKIKKRKVVKSEWEAPGRLEIFQAEEGGLFGRRITEKKLDEVLWDLEIVLLESDVALPVVEEIKGYLKKELSDRKVSRSADIDAIIESGLRNAIANALSQEVIDFDRFVRAHEKPVKLMFVGVNGTGKTTAIARIAHRLKRKGFSSVIAAGDTFRAGAIEQLQVHADRLGIKLIHHEMGADPAAVAYDAVEHAKARSKDVVLIDTAGRMQTNTNLMDEMKKIQRVVKPDMVIFVGDSLAGNDAVEQARTFNEAVRIDAVILTKIDADAKGGAALSIAHAVGRPILFVGTGQGYDDLEPFRISWMVDRLFGE